ncbi:MAG: hypothetical protein ABI380_02595 [Edaphobacter sp.]
MKRVAAIDPRLSMTKREGAKAAGLKAGIYTDIGRNTCYPNPRYQGSYGHEQQDADTFAAWGMDFVEMDYCNLVEEHTGKWVYERMAEAIKQTGRPMIFYLCSCGNEQPWEWAQGKAQMWRTDFDISLEKNHVEWDRMVGNFESNAAHSVFSGPGSWNDADMLEIGNPGLNDRGAGADVDVGHRPISLTSRCSKNSRRRTWPRSMGQGARLADQWKLRDHAAECHREKCVGGGPLIQA